MDAPLFAHIHQLAMTETLSSVNDVREAKDVASTKPVLERLHQLHMLRETYIGYTEDGYTLFTLSRLETLLIKRCNVSMFQQNRNAPY